MFIIKIIITITLQYLKNTRGAGILVDGCHSYSLSEKENYKKNKNGGEDPLL